MTKIDANRDRVRFDYAGSLELARKMWALADLAAASRKTRKEAGETALRSWAGPYADQFRVRMSDEEASLRKMESRLREEACKWAEAWKRAMDEQNRRNRSLKVDEIRDRRSWLERNVGDRFVDDDSDAQVSPAPEAGVPQPPHFAATQAERCF